MKRIKTILVQTFNKLKHRVILICCIFSFLNTSAQTWTQRADFGGGARYDAVGFSIGNKGYILCGYNTGRDFWEWDQATNTWTRKADFPGDVSLDSPVGFSIGTKGYVGTGNNSQSFWEWDQATNTWTQKADFGGQGRYGAVGFSIGTKGYIGFGYNGGLYPYSYSSDFWEWDQATNTWTQKASKDSLAFFGNVGFSIGTKGYVMCDGKFWEWDQSTNTWTRKTDAPSSLIFSVGFTIGSKGYVVTGDTAGVYQGPCNHFYEYDPNTDTWTQKINFAGASRDRAVGFSIGNKGYVGTGKKSGGYCSDFWEYCDTCTTNVIGLNNLLNYAIYPNPATNQFTIILPQSMNATYSLNDLQGNPAKKGKTTNSQTEINVADLPRGMYILKVVTDKQIVTKKVVLQ